MTQKKQVFAFFICLLIASVEARAASSFTTLTEFPSPFCYLENLYFIPHSAQFVIVGDHSILGKVISIKDQRGYSFSYKKAPFRNVTRVSGTTLFLFEMPRTIYCTYHFFHILEHVVGDWVFHGEQHFQDVTLIVLASAGEKDWKLHDNVLPVHWEGPNEINQHLLKALYPNARVLTWMQFIEEFQEGVICFERAFTSDRGVAESHYESASIGRMLGYCRSFLSQEALQNMSDRVHSYAQTEMVPNSGTLRVTYLKRIPPRTLAPDVEEKLFAAIQALDHVSLRVEDFTKISFKEQINIIGNTDVLISVHGNGLSHTLFLPPSAKVIEIFPPSTHTVDYRIYAEARGLDYTCIMSDRGIIPKEVSYSLGMRGNFYGTIYDLDVDLVLKEIATK